MFEARLVQGSLLKTVLETVKDLLNEATLDWSNEGIQLQGMDNSHVLLVTVNMRADSFDEFWCNRTISMGVNLTKMFKILRYGANEDIITMEIKDQAETVTFTFESPNKRKASEYEMELNNLDQEHLGTPGMSFSAVIKMPSGELQRVVSDLSQFSKSLVLSCDKEGIKFSATSNNGSGTIKIIQWSDGGEEEAVIIEMHEPVTMVFACRYLNMLTKASRLASQVSLYMSPDRLMIVEYTISEIGHVRFYLAPMIVD